MTERQLFEFLKERFLPDLEMSEEPMSHWDCYSAQWAFDIELKCRRTHYDELLIEKMKYDNLIARSAKFETNPIYINSTPVGIYVFRLATIEIKWETKRMPATTDFAKTYKVDKVVGFLNVNQAKQIYAFTNP